MFELSPTDWMAIEVTLKLAIYTTLILLVIATPIAWWLANGRAPGGLRTAVQALVALPLVLPPTVLGFYLLVLLGPAGPVGSTLESWGLNHLAFTFQGILIASVIYSLPFAVQPLQQAFANLGRRPTEIAGSLGAGRMDRFFTVILPMTRGGFIVAATLAFAHTLGEFGVILMLGGAIPGETQVLSILIYDHAEAMDFASAHRLSFGLLIFAFVVLFVVYAINRRFDTVRL